MLDRKAMDLPQIPTNCFEAGKKSGAHPSKEFASKISASVALSSTSVINVGIVSIC